MSSIIFIISFILEGILSLYIPFNMNDLNIYYVSFTLVAVIICYPIFKYKKKLFLYYIMVVLLGFIYDLVYTDVLLLHSLLFFISALIVDKFYLKFNINNYMFLLLCIIVITNYNLVYYLILILFQNYNFSFYNLFYKIIHSYFINLLYGYILYIIVSKYRIKRHFIHKN